VDGEDVNLTPEGKEEMALALLLWKDFKSAGKLSVYATVTAITMADKLGVRKEYDELNIKLPPMKIEPRHP